MPAQRNAVLSGLFLSLHYLQVRARHASATHGLFFKDLLAKKYLPKLLTRDSNFDFCRNPSKVDKTIILLCMALDVGNASIEC